MGVTLPRWVRLASPFLTLWAILTGRNWYYGSDERLHWWKDEE